MKFISQLKFKVLILVCVASFFCFFSINSANALFYDYGFRIPVDETTPPNNINWGHNAGGSEQTISAIFKTEADQTKIDGIEFYIKVETGCPPTNYNLNLTLYEGQEDSHFWYTTATEVATSSMTYAECTDILGIGYVWFDFDFWEQKNISANSYYTARLYSGDFSDGERYFSGSWTGDYSANAYIAYYTSIGGFATSSASDLAFKTYSIPWYNEDDITGVEIIELPEIGEVTVQAGVEEFKVNKDFYCDYESNIDCFIKYYYPYEMIGYYLLLMEDTATSTTDYVDFDILEDKTYLEGLLSPVDRDYETTDTYNIFYFNPLDEGTTTAGLITDINVHWVSSTTQIQDEFEIPVILKYFSQVFPLSILLQVNDFFNEYRTQPTGYEEFVIPFDMFIASTTGYTVTGNLFEASWPQENLSWYDDLIIYLINAFIVGILLLVLYKQMRALFSSPE